MFASMTMQEATFLLLKKLRKIYSDSEANIITDWVMEHLTGSKKTERMFYKNEAITSTEETLLNSYIERLLAHEPVQYVLGECWFCGLKFYVDRHVLIPRPETEELVEWIIKDFHAGKFQNKQNFSILDIGTGSGCIPVSLKKRLGGTEVWSCDVSADAIGVARKNAVTLGTDVNFLQVDFLDDNARKQLISFDIIVSNPPYVPLAEKKEMSAHVVAYEPSTALFVPDEDALVFYKAIATFGKTNLKKGGHMYVEISENLGAATQVLFQEHGYSAELKKDMQGKDRMIRAIAIS